MVSFKRVIVLHKEREGLWAKRARPAEKKEKREGGGSMWLRNENESKSKFLPLSLPRLFLVAHTTCADIRQGG